MGLPPTPTARCGSRRSGRTPARSPRDWPPSGTPGRACGGFIDTVGAVRIAPAYDAIAGDGFRDGRASVVAAGKWGSINPAGAWVVPAEYGAPVRFCDRLACVEKDGRWGYIDPAGRWVIQPTFLLARDFSQSRAAVLVGGERLGRRVVGGRWGYIDPAGRSAVDPHYASAGTFAEGLAPVSLPDDLAGHGSRFAGYIDADGKVIIEPAPWSWGRPFAGGLAAVRHGETGLWGFIDGDGRVAVEPQYVQVRDFSGGLAAVEITVAAAGAELPRRLWGYVDADGRVAIEPAYDRAGNFRDARAAVRAAGQFRLITPDGTTVFPKPVK